MVNYQSGDLESLGKLCNSITTLAEWYGENRNPQAAARVPMLLKYLDGKFRDCLVLILKNSDKHYAYTANNITKFIRGETLHGASENVDTKRTVLHEYVFEKDNTIECEFQVSWNWIAGPNLRADSGDLDSGGPFVHAVNLNGIRREVSLIESVVLAIAYEFWQANTNGQPEQSTKCFVKFNPSWYSAVWGESLAERLGMNLKQYSKLSLPDSDESP
jgi:hypothetical protein